MDIFVSSVITDYKNYRDEATEAIRDLGHNPRRIEDEPSLASTTATPQRACMALIQACDLVVLLLGERYGPVQADTGKSATHEEWAEARRITKPVLAFVEDVPDREELQRALVEEVSDWETGCLRVSYRSPEDLRAHVVRAVARFASDPTLSSKGWRRLLQVDQNARDVVPRSLRGPDVEVELTLKRAGLRSQFADALLRNGDLMVRGESGVGKSTLILDTIESLAPDENVEALAMNLRHLPDTPLGLDSALGEPLGDC